VLGGVDTHKDVHVAAVIDALGRLLGTESFPATRHGCRRLLRWMRSHGDLVVASRDADPGAPAWPVT
jgi:transposase